MIFYFIHSHLYRSDVELLFIRHAVVAFDHWKLVIIMLSTFADVRTQAMYQLLDSGFIGLIFSCFSEDANKVYVKNMVFRR
jgi:hypothetical protein